MISESEDEDEESDPEEVKDYPEPPDNKIMEEEIIQ